MTLPLTWRNSTYDSETPLVDLMEQWTMEDERTPRPGEDPSQGATDDPETDQEPDTTPEPDTVEDDDGE